MRHANITLFEPCTFDQWYQEPPAILDLEEPLGNVHVGRAVFTHRPLLEQVRVRPMVAHRKQEVER